jgi:DNA-binding MarR family transcriptional regulator
MAKRSINRFRDTELASEIEFLLARARNMGIMHANESLVSLGLKARSYVVLSLAVSGLKPTQRELADFINLDASQIVAIVDDLEKKGLVARQPAPSDRRTNVIVATDLGVARYGQARAVTAQAELESLSALSSDEQQTLRDLLTRVVF